MRFAAEFADAHFILLGGAGSDPFIREAQAAIAERQLTARFTFLDGDRPIEDVASVMSIADVFTSFMRELDMRPFASILEATACGGVPVLGEQSEYRAMEQLGFTAAICPVDDDACALDALRRYASDRALREGIARQNGAYLEKYEDGLQQASALLHRIRAVCDAYRSAPLARRRDRRRTAHASW
jgi:glycosyltransferase involved in cell wall biosynthesis